MVDLILYVTLPVIAAMGLLVLWLRRSRSSSPKGETHLSIVQEGVLTTQVGAPSQLQMAHFNPLAYLSFDALINGNDQSLASMEDEATSFLVSVAQHHGGDVANALLQLAGTATQNGTHLAKFLPEVQRALQSGAVSLMKDQSGQNLLTAVAKNGRTVAQGRELAPVASGLLKSANVVAIVVSTAHIISGYDNAKRLRAINKQVDLLLRCQSNEMLSKLEAVFEILRERLSLDVVPDKLLLNQLKMQLKELRIAWLRQVEGALQDIDNPEQRALLAKWFSKTFGGNKGKANDIVNAVTAQEVNVHLVRIAIFLEEVIATVLGEHDTFAEITVQGIAVYLQRLESLLMERKEFVAKLINEPPQAIEEQAKLVAALRESLDDDKASDLTKPA